MIVYSFIYSLNIINFILVMISIKLSLINRLIMDLIGEIIEHDIDVPVAPKCTTSSGFPSTKEFKKSKISKWKQRKEANKSSNNESVNVALPEAEKIHRENMEKISNMSEEEILKEKEELFQNLDWKLIQSLLKRTDKRVSLKQESSPENTESNTRPEENYKGWFGNARTKNGWEELTQLDSEDVDRALGIQKLDLDDIQEDQGEKAQGESSGKKSVRFSKEIEEKEILNNDNDVKPFVDDDSDSENEVAHEDYQIVLNDSSEDVSVHFPKPPQHSELDLDDPDFYNKLHEKYFPDLPKETKKLAWMSEPMPTTTSSTYESISDMRFDFAGNLMNLEDGDEELPTYMGLHHHSEDPNLPGYTLPELAHLARSSLPAQRCISIRTLGRILHKLGLGMYNILPVGDFEEEGDGDERDMKDSFEKLMRDLIQKLRIIETITDAASESKTANLSVRNYAIEALWLWKKAQENTTTKD